MTISPLLIDCTQVLKNDGGVLPLSAATTTSIAIIGKEAVFPTTHGGGSGQVFPGYAATPLWSVRNKLSFPQPPLPTNNCSDGNFDVGYDYRNTDSQTSQAGSRHLAHVCTECADVVLRGGPLSWCMRAGQSQCCMLCCSINHHIMCAMPRATWPALRTAASCVPSALTAIATTSRTAPGTKLAG